MIQKGLGGRGVIENSVGEGGMNDPEDVRTIQQLLNDRLHDGAPMAVDGNCGPGTIAAIKKAQASLLRMTVPDGLVSPNGPTIHALSPVTPTLPVVLPNGIPAEIVAAAQAAELKWGVPAAISVAQWALESGRGVHMPPGSNNPFGIKARPGDPAVTVQTREVDGNGNSYYINAPFRKFNSIAEAFDFHGELLATSGHYKAAMAAAGDPNAFADALTGVYATDPHYGTALKQIMKGSDLYQLD